MGVVRVLDSLSLQLTFYSLNGTVSEKTSYVLQDIKTFSLRKLVVYRI